MGKGGGKGAALLLPRLALRYVGASGTSTAQRTAFTTLANSASKPSPVFFTIRPLCCLIFGSTSSPRWALSRSCVPSSSAPIKREYPATSAARIAVRRRTVGMTCPAVDWLNQIYLETRGDPSAAIGRVASNVALVLVIVDHPASNPARPVPHSIISSARARNAGGIVKPIALAVFMLMISSNFDGCWMGRSAGLAPFRTLST